MAQRVTKEAVAALVRKWRGRLGLAKGWSIEIAVREDDEWPEDYADAVAYVEVDHGYFNARLYIHKQKAEVHGDTLEHIVLHELVHVVLWPLRVVTLAAFGAKQSEHGESINEAATEQLTRALLLTARGRR